MARSTLSPNSCVLVGSLPLSIGRKPPSHLTASTHSTNSRYKGKLPCTTSTTRFCIIQTTSSSKNRLYVFSRALMCSRLKHSTVSLSGVPPRVSYLAPPSHAEESWPGPRPGGCQRNCARRAGGRMPSVSSPWTEFAGNFGNCRPTSVRFV